MEFNTRLKHERAGILKVVIFIFATFIVCHVRAQNHSDSLDGKFPDHILYSSDTIKEIYVRVSTYTRTENDKNTIIKLEESKIKEFIADFNCNDKLESQNSNVNFYRVTAKPHNYGEKMYELVFISKNNNKTFYFIKKNIMGISIGDQNNSYVMYSPAGQIGLFYKLRCRNILKKYNLTFERK